jgi:hypothetical protein
MTHMMVRNGLWRVDVLGQGRGMWTIHPEWRSPRFYQELPSLIERVECGDVPDGQRGRHDLHDSFFDWSDARRENTISRRLQKNATWARAGIAQRLKAPGPEETGGGVAGGRNARSQ